MPRRAPSRTRGARLGRERGGKEVAVIVPTTPVGSRLAGLPEVLRSLPRLGSEEAEAFADDLDRIHADANREAPVDPWAS